MLTTKVLLALLAAGGVVAAPAHPKKDDSAHGHVKRQTESEGAFTLTSAVVATATEGAFTLTSAVVATATADIDVPDATVTGDGAVTSVLTVVTAGPESTGTVVPPGDQTGGDCALPSIPAGITKAAPASGKRFVAYYSSYHGISGQEPSATQLNGVTHLILGMSPTSCV